MTFREIIIGAARKQGLSGYALAKLAGLPMRTVQAYLSGENDLAGGRIEKLAAALGLALRPAGRTKKGGR